MLTTEWVESAVPGACRPRGADRHPWPSTTTSGPRRYLDAVAGDHGIGMSAAHAGPWNARLRSVGGGAHRGGRTAPSLGTGLRARIGNQNCKPDAQQVSDGVAHIRSIQQVGKADIGDKTLVDAPAPASDARCGRGG